ncbi:MAG: hypothetical protein AAGE83_09965, partial [Pseudomonadota bacterium]
MWPEDWRIAPASGTNALRDVAVSRSRRHAQASPDLLLQESDAMRLPFADPADCLAEDPFLIDAR